MKINFENLPEGYRIRLGIAGMVIAISTAFLFGSLGHYALWDDEAETALIARGVTLTGDTTVVLGHNIVARRGGINVRNLHERFTPPLPVYLIAASMSLLGQNSFAARLPFAICGLVTIGIILLILWRLRVSILTWVITGIAVLGNVSLFLYLRQARYYGPVLLLTAVIAYVYLNWAGRRSQAIAISLASAGLFLSNQICFLEINVILLVDYFLFRRHDVPLLKLNLPWLLIPQFVIITATSFVWNPFLTHAEEHMGAITILDRLTLLWWNIRDLNQAEFGVGTLLLMAPVVFYLGGNLWILRGLIALAATVFVASAISHQDVSVTSVADVRYITPCIPICIAVGVMTIEFFARGIPWLAVSIAVIAFWTNFLHGGWIHGNLRSTIVEYVGELVDPPTEPYTRVSQWVAKNIPYGTSLWVMPEYMNSPLMFHAPNAVYAWQIAADNHDPQFAKLARIHFMGVTPPQYIIAFGPVVVSMAKLLENWSTRGVRYQHIATIDTFWKDLYRPELFWRTFKPVSNYNKTTEAIYIFKLQS